MQIAIFSSAVATTEMIDYAAGLVKSFMRDQNSLFVTDQLGGISQSMVTLCSAEQYTMFVAVPEGRASNFYLPMNAAVYSVGINNDNRDYELIRNMQAVYVLINGKPSKHVAEIIDLATQRGVLKNALVFVGNGDIYALPRQMPLV